MKLIGLFAGEKFNHLSTALIYGNSSITYSEFDEKILSTIQTLSNLGIKRRNKVAILSDSSPEFVILIFALWRLGAIPIPLNLKLLSNEIEELITFAHCDFLLTDDSSFDLIDHEIIPKYRIPNANEKANTKTFPEIDFIIDDTATIIFTSGSTGKPKGVMLSFNNLFQSALTGDQIFNHTGNDRWLASLPFYHVGGFSIITRAFFFGAALIIPQSLSIEHIKEAIENQKPSLTSLVSTQLKRLIELRVKPNKELRHILLGGGFLDSELVEKAISQGWKVSKSYGSTETSSFVAALNCDEFKNKQQSAGKALTPNKILIVDEHKHPLLSNQFGEIAIKGESVGKGYLNNDEETKIKFKGKIYYSGDFGYLDDDGYLFVEARRNDLIISGGENINPVEVEKEIKKHSDILDVSVLGLENKEWGHIVAAAIVLKNKNEFSFDGLKEFLKDKLPAFKHPKKIIILKSLPKTEMGKIQKEKLREILINESKR